VEPQRQTYVKPTEARHNRDPSGDATPQAMNPLWKTRLCNFYDSRSGCRHGRLCTFAHGQEELRKAPDFTRTSICPELLRTGKCRQVSSCQYAHSHAELRSTPGLLKTRMCDFHKTGSCMAGDYCRFAHEVSELSSAASLMQTSSRTGLSAGEQDASFEELEALRPGPPVEAGMAPAAQVSGPGDPQLRQDLLTQECAIIEESLYLLRRWSSLPPEGRARLFDYLRHLHAVQGQPPIPEEANLAQLPIPGFVRIASGPNAGFPTAFGPEPGHRISQHQELPAFSKGKDWRSAPSAAPEAEEWLEQRLKTMTEFFAESLRGPR